MTKVYLKPLGTKQSYNALSGNTIEAVPAVIEAESPITSTYLPIDEIQDIIFLQSSLKPSNRHYRIGFIHYGVLYSTTLHETQFEYAVKFYGIKPINSNNHVSNIIEPSIYGSFGFYKSGTKYVLKCNSSPEVIKSKLPNITNLEYGKLYHNNEGIYYCYLGRLKKSKRNVFLEVGKSQLYNTDIEQIILNGYGTHFSITKSKKLKFETNSYLNVPYKNQLIDKLKDILTKSNSIRYFNKGQLNQIISEEIY